MAGRRYSFAIAMERFMRKAAFLSTILSGLVLGFLCLTQETGSAEPKARYWISISTVSAEDATRACRKEAPGAVCAEPIGGCVTSNYIALAVGVGEDFSWATTAGDPVAETAISNAINRCNASVRKHGARCSLAGVRHPGCLFAVAGCAGDCPGPPSGGSAPGAGNQGP
jgi:hypothetical protein